MANIRYIRRNWLETFLACVFSTSCFYLRKGRFTRYNFVACDKLTTSLQHESFHLLNQTYNLLTIVAYDTKNVVGF